MIRDCKITTFDNPYDPFEQFTSWLLFDNEKGYHSIERAMRLAHLTDDMSSAEVDAEVERAIDKLIEIDFTNTFKKVVREYETT